MVVNTKKKNILMVVSKSDFLFNCHIIEHFISIFHAAVIIKKELLKIRVLTLQQVYTNNVPSYYCSIEKKA